MVSTRQEDKEREKNRERAGMTESMLQNQRNEETVWGIHAEHFPVQDAGAHVLCLRGNTEGQWSWKMKNKSEHWGDGVSKV